jgi:hypothetical protein
MDLNMNQFKKAVLTSIGAQEPRFFLAAAPLWPFDRWSTALRYFAVTEPAVLATFSGVP